MNKKQKILVIGSSGDIGTHLVKDLVYNNLLFAHINKSKTELSKIENDNITILQKEIKSQKDCKEVVYKAHKHMKGLDVIVILIGGITKLVSWTNISEKNWNNDVSLNLSYPFFLAQEAFKLMKKNGGKIIFCSTASALYGGGKESIAYGISKYGLEFLTKRLAKDGAIKNILVNTVAPGFIDSKLHRNKLKKSNKDFSKRVKLIPLNRAGTPKEVSSVLKFLISNNSSYITGEIIRVSGGDWL